MPLHSRVVVLDDDRTRARSLVELLVAAGYDAHDLSPTEAPPACEVVLLASGGTIRATSARHGPAFAAAFAPLDSVRLTLAALERRYILHVLALEAGHQSRAAARLGIDRRTLYRKLKEYRDADVDIRIAG